MIRLGRTSKLLIFPHVEVVNEGGGGRPQSKNYGTDSAVIFTEIRSLISTLAVSGAFNAV